MPTYCGKCVIGKGGVEALDLLQVLAVSRTACRRPGRWPVSAFRRIWLSWKTMDFTLLSPTTISNNEQQPISSLILCAKLIVKMLGYTRPEQLLWR